MSTSNDEIDALVSYCRTHLGDQNSWPIPDGYPDSLALCVIDAIYSTGSHYSSVVKVINRYRSARGDTDGAKALLSSIADAGGPRMWAADVAGNLKPAHTRRGAPLKADVVEQAARMLTSLGVDTVPELVEMVEDNPMDNPVHIRWKRLPSQSSGVTYNYMLILAGLPSVKPDRMVLRFLNDVVGGNKTAPAGAVELIQAAAAKLEVSPRTLDHVIWRTASGASAQLRNLPPAIPDGRVRWAF